MNKKIFIALVLGLSSLLVATWIVKNQNLREQKATLRIGQPSDVDGFFSLVSQVKQMTSYSVMKAVATRLGEIDEATSESEVQRRVLELQNDLFVEIKQDSNLVEIFSRNTNGAYSKKLINTTVSEYLIYSQEVETQNLRVQQRSILLEIEAIKEASAGLESRIVDLKKAAYEDPSLNSSFLEAEITKLAAQKKELLEVFTPKHPDVLSVDSEMEKLSLLLKESQPANELGQLQKQLSELDQVMFSKSDQLQELKLKEAQLSSGQTQIINLAGNGASGMLSPLLMGLVFSGGFLLGWFLVWIFERLFCRAKLSS